MSALSGDNIAIAIKTAADAYITALPKDANGVLVTPLDTLAFEKARWNAFIAYVVSVAGSNPALYLDGTATFTAPSGGGGGSGEVNVGANVGTTGVGPYDGKVGVTLDFRNVAPGSTKVTVSLNSGAKTIEIDVDTAVLFASPALTGNPTAPTQVSGNNTTRVATTAFVQSAIADLINGAPGALDTLKELADAINDDASFAATITAALAAKAPLASPTLTGNPTGPTPSVDDNDTSLATTAYVIAQLSASGDGTPAMDGTAARGTSTHGARADHVHPTDTSRAPLASPALTGTPTTPTAVAGTNTTQIASTAFVAAAVVAAGGVSTARAINTTAPLAGGGDLSADRTHSLTTDSSLQVINSKLSIVSGVYGDGSDGPVHYTVNATLTADVNATTVLVDGGVTVTTAGFRIFATGTITNNGIIDNSGAVGGSGASGGATAAKNFYASGGAGGSGGSGGAGNAGGAVIGAIGGAGGAGGAGVGVGPAGGNLTGPAATLGSYRNAFNLLIGALLSYGGSSTTVTTTAMQTGSGGGGGTASGTGAIGGKGGGAGGWLFLAAPRIINNGVISANGGNGGAGTLGAGTFAAGGGGGGGGIVACLTGSFEGTPPVATGGTKGGGAGTASVAADGNPGKVFIITPP